MRFLVVLIFMSLVFALSAVWRALGHWAGRTELNQLIRFQPQGLRLFYYVMIANLPEPAQRFFKLAIAEGTPLLAVADIGDAA